METYKILIVEDDNDINNLLADLLEGAGHRIGQAFSGTEALLYIKHERWDMVLLDLMLPGKSGEEVLELIRAQYDMPVLVISAKEELKTKVELLRGGADDFITKPFDVEEVLARTEAHLRRYRIGAVVAQDDAHKRSYMEITLDKECRKVWVNEAEVSLTGREFDILELLMTYPKKVFSKANLFESVWGEDYLGEDNTLNVHISNIRSKLAKAGATHEYIQTVWGIGYKFET